MLYTVMAAVLVLFDQYTKIAAKTALAEGGAIKIIDGVLDFVYVENRGAAFGIMQDTRWLLVALTFVVLGVLAFYIIKTKSRHPLMLASAAAVFAGGIGNLIDRIFVGYVTDFIHVLFIDFPCFNVADICVCVGGALLVVYLLFIDIRKGENND